LTSQKLEKGDIAYVEIDSWVLSPDGTKKLHDTTREELAKQEKVHDEKKVYGEMPVFLGKDRLPKGLEEELLTKSVGDEGEVTVPPEKGAGPRDAKLVALKPLREFLKKDIDPAIGMPVVVDGKRGYISAITAGRVRVDFNSPLAGKTLLYKYKINKKAENLVDRVRGLIEMDYGLGEQFRIGIEDGQAEIVIPDVCKTDERWFIVKFRVVADLRELEGLKKIRFIEDFEKKEERPAEKKAEEKHEHKEEEEAPAKETKAAPPPPEKPKKEEKPAREKKGKKAEKAEEEIAAEEKSPEEL